MLKEVEIQEHFIQLSFDIRSLFPSIPIKPTLTLIHEKLQNDKLLNDRTMWQPKIYCEFDSDMNRGNPF